MQVQDGIVQTLIYNPMPSLVEEDVGLFEKFHQIGLTDPLKSFGDFVSYFFQTLSLWIIAVTRIFSSMGCAIGEVAKSEESKKVFIECSKSSLYYSWVSLCLPFIFLGGYVVEGCRKPFLEIEGPMTEDTARRKYFRVKEELKQSKISQERADKDKTTASDRVMVLEGEFQHLTQAIQQGNQGEVLQIFAQRLAEERTADIRRQMAVLEQENRNFREDNHKLSADIEVLREVQVQLELDIRAYESTMAEWRTALKEPSLTLEKERFLVTLATLARQGKDVTLTQHELQRAFPRPETEGTS